MAYDIPTATLGRTGLTVTRLGIGGAYCEDADGYRRALDSGANYIDTARLYRGGEDEKVIGQAIKGRREDIILATKTGRRDAKGARQDLEISLKLLGTDYIDIWQVHNLNIQSQREQALSKNGAMETFHKAKEEGLIRFMGVTGHDWVQVGEAVATGLFDTVLCWYNCAMREPEESVFPHAVAHNTGVVVMNASRNEKLFSDSGNPAPEAFYRYVLSNDAVNMTIMALRNVDLFWQIASALSQSTTITRKEKAELEEYGSKMRAEGKL